MLVSNKLLARRGHNETSASVDRKRYEASASARNPNIKAIRKKTGLSQDEFAYAFGFTFEQIRAWEHGRNRLLGGVGAYFMMIDLDHEGVSRILVSMRKPNKKNKAA